MPLTTYIVVFKAQKNEKTSYLESPTPATCFREPVLHQVKSKKTVRSAPGQLLCTVQQEIFYELERLAI